MDSLEITAVNYSIFSHKITIKNCSSENLLLCMKFYNTFSYSSERIGTFTLPKNKSYVFNNKQLPRLLILSAGIMRDDINKIELICNDVPIFNNIKFTDDHIPYKKTTLKEFESETDSGQIQIIDTDDSTVYEKNASNTVTNSTSGYLLCSFGIHDVLNNDSFIIGWIYLPPNTSHKIVNHITTKLLTITAGIPVEDSNLVGIICEDTPVSYNLEFDNNYVPFKKITYNDLTGEDENDDSTTLSS
jgi:hypothetical protein